MSDTAIVQNTTKAGQPVKITVENAPVATEPSPEIPEEKPVDPTSPAERSELIPTDNWQTSPMFYELANFLGLEARDYDSSADQISVITDWAIQHANSNKVEDIMHAIRDLEGKLQPPPWGERRVSHIYRALRMEARYEASKKAMGAYSRTGKWE